MENKEQPIADNTVEKQVIKKPRKKKFERTDEVIKVDLTKPANQEEIKDEPKQEVTESTTDDAGVVGGNESPEAAPEQEEVQPQAETQETPVLEEVSEEEIKEQAQEVAEKVEEAVAEAVESGKPLPENIQKLVDFMEETGGGLEDYVRLNRDISSLDDQTVLYEYYKSTKPHLTNEEINFLMEDNFDYDEEVDDERDVKRKKLAFKEQVANAKSHLDNQKSKYYEEIKAGSRLTPEAKKAMDFFNRYNKESEQSRAAAEKQRDVFDKRTNEVFNNDFKGFEYNVGDKTYRYSVKDANEVKATQSDINNFVKKFLSEDNTISDAKGYHKSLFTAMNADAIAKHFYEQGKSDAMKDSVAKSKNVDMEPRQSHGEINLGGTKYRIVNGDTSSDYKVKIRRNRK